ncbi:MAG: FAD-binding oxidoreductase [Thermoplasmata archaeon]|nr:FAD-binding oxidoreductase [Thermoplasmata archaeon]
MSRSEYDLAVVGAGIVGAACAYEAARAGLRVTVIDGSRSGSGATGSAMGHIVALDGSEPELALCRFSQGVWRELAGRLPASAHYRPAGTIWLAREEADLRDAETKHDRLRKHDVPSRTLDPEELNRTEPAVRAGLSGGLLVPEDALVDPLPVTDFLLAETIRMGGHVIVDSPVTRIEEGGVHRAGRDAIRAKSVLNAAGVAAPQLSEGVPVRPRKGHLLRVEKFGPTLGHQLVELGYGSSVRSTEATSVAFNVQPASDGSWTVGASREWGSTSTEVDPATVARVWKRAAEFLPSLARATVAKSWAGLRPAMPDHLPWIGRLPGSDSIWVATGHEGLGITCSMGTARLVVASLLGRRTEIPLEPYRPRTERAPWPSDYSLGRGAA